MKEIKAFFRYLECHLQDEILITGKSKLAKWLIFYGIWTAVALVFAGEIKALKDHMGEPVSWLKAFVTSVSFFYLWAVLSLFVLGLGRRFPIEKPHWRRNIPIHVIASFVFPIFHIALFLFVDNLGVVLKLSSASALATDGSATASYWETFQVFFLDNFASGVLMYWIILVVGQSIRIYKRYQQQQVEYSQLETQFAQAQLQSLKMQLHPHFLFNTLNSISTLIHRDPEAADRMLTRLSDLLRLTLETSGTQEVDLQHELDFLQRYLEMEQIRLGDRLAVEMDIEPSLLDAQVPNLILQPLVENAIRHGIAPHARNGVIKIKGSRDNGMIELEVSDNGEGLSESAQDQLEEGVGISNTRKRLNQMYGDRQRFELRNGLQGGLVATVTIPYQNNSEVIEEEAE